MLALKPIAEHRTYNLDGAEKITIRQIAETVQKIIGKVEIRYVEERPGDFRGKEGISRRAKEELGWEPKVSFEDGLRRYIEWYETRQLSRDEEWAQTDAELRTGQRA